MLFEQDITYYTSLHTYCDGKSSTYVNIQLVDYKNALKVVSFQNKRNNLKPRKDNIL